MWRAKRCPIKGVEHFPADLDFIAFPKGNVLAERYIGIVVPGTGKHVAPGISEGTRRVRYERRGIEVFLKPMTLRTGMNLQWFTS